MTITKFGNGGMSFTGEDVNVFQVAALRSGLGLWAVGIKPHRSWTSLRLALETATHYTGKKYKGKKDIEQARTDLQEWLQQSALKTYFDKVNANES